MSEQGTTITAEQRQNKKIAIIVQAVRLLPEEPGLDRAEFMASVMAAAGYDVDLITSTFQHWQKQHRVDVNPDNYADRPYHLVFLHEPGYRKNIDLSRIKSHKILCDSLKDHLDAHGDEYSLIFCQIPPNNLARVAGEYANAHNIPFIVDVNDLWPQAMRMALNIPVISDIAFSGFEKDAKCVYESADGVIATSVEYSQVPASYTDKPHKKEVVYVGGNIQKFDRGVDMNAGFVEKPEDEIWFTYAGTLGKSYDIKTLIEAAHIVQSQPELLPDNKSIRVKILGIGPDAESLQAMAVAMNAPVDFLGFMQYQEMAGYLYRSDVLVNSLVKDAPQSIVSKISDYLAAGRPILNTGTSDEMQRLLCENHCGMSVVPEDPQKLANKMITLALHSDMRRIYGANARQLAVERFDRAIEYQKALNLIDSMLF